VNVLIADDDPVFTRLTVAALGLRGCRVTVVRDAIQALMSAMRAQPDAIVLDINMPGGTGLGALAKLKQSYRTRAIPVVVVTAGSAAEDEAKALALGAAEFLRKPVPALVLYAAVCRAVEPQGSAMAS
jgi:CheY-like chemotaxis protein